MPTYKLVLVGNAKSGKSKYVRSVMGYDEPSFYTPTLGAEVHPFQWDEETVINIWDTAGDKRYLGLDDVYWQNADGFLIFDDNDNEEYEHYASRIRDKMGENVIIIRKNRDVISDFAHCLIGNTK